MLVSNADEPSPSHPDFGFREFGSRSGEPLLLVHAGVFASWFHRLAASHALQDFRLIVVRRAGYGGQAPTHPLSIPDHADHLSTLADLLQIPKLHCVGHSSSALIGLQLARSRPELLQSPVLIEPAPCGVLHVPGELELREKYVGPAMVAFTAGDLARAFDSFMRGVCGKDYSQVMERTLGQAGSEKAMRESEYFFREEIPAAIQWNLSAPELAAINQPVLILEGQESRQEGPMSRQISERALQLLPHAELAMIANANHMMPLQEPDALGAAIAGFARKHAISSKTSKELK